MSLSTMRELANTVDSLSTKELAEKLGRAPKTVADWRTRGKGPKYTRPPGTAGFYRITDVIEWLESDSEVQA